MGADVVIAEEGVQGVWGDETGRGGWMACVFNAMKGFVLSQWFSADTGVLSLDPCILPSLSVLGVLLGVPRV